MADTPSNSDQTTDPLAGSTMSALGPPPAGVQQGDPIPVGAPPDIPPSARVRPSDLDRDNSDGGRGGSGGGGGGATRTTVDAFSLPMPIEWWAWPNWFWQTAREKAVAAEPQTAETQEAVAWIDSSTLAERAAEFVRILTHEDLMREPERTDVRRRYAIDLAYVMGIRGLLKTVGAHEHAARTMATVNTLKQAVIARIAPMVGKDVLAAIEEVDVLGGKDESA